MQNSFFIVAPEVATVGQSSRAYLQRYVTGGVVVVPHTESVASFLSFSLGESSPCSFVVVFIQFPSEFAQESS